MIRRLIVLPLALVAGVVVAVIDAAPIWTLCVLAALMWGVFLAFVAKFPARLSPCACDYCTGVKS